MWSKYITAACILCTWSRETTSFTQLSQLAVTHHDHNPLNNVIIGSTTILYSTTETEVEIERDVSGRKRSGGRKFAALMAGEVSSPLSGFEPITWNYDDAMKSTTTGSIIHTAILPDDEIPPGVTSCTPSTLHNKRTLYYHPSLLTEDEATSLQRAAEQSGRFEEFDSRCAVIVEDGVYQADEDDTGRASPSLSSLLQPIIESKILPWAREMCNTRVIVADALIRSYDPSEERQDLATHYDNTAFASCVIALNDPTTYEGGLFVQYGAHVDTRLGVPFTSPGDAVLHRFDVMHGVNVRSGKKRYSLVIWFGEEEDNVSSKTVPWVMREAQQGTSVHAAFLHAFNSQYGIYGTEKDVQAAKEYYNYASERGHALSAYMLSNILFKEACSNDVSKESQSELQNQSHQLLQLSAARGLASAQHELGISYKQGYRGLLQDIDLAKYWFTLAERQGHAPSAQVLRDSSRWDC